MLLVTRVGSPHCSHSDKPVSETHDTSSEARNFTSRRSWWINCISRVVYWFERFHFCGFYHHLIIFQDAIPGSFEDFEKEYKEKVSLEAGAEIIGINNRNLETFIVDLQVTEKLASLIPENKVIVSESGIRTRADIDYLAKHGVHAVLVGEALVSSEDPAMVLRSLL